MTQLNINKPYRMVSSVTINASRQQIWDVLKDFGNVYTWAAQVSESYVIADAPPGVGHGRHCEIDGFGGIDEIISEWSEGEGFEYYVEKLIAPLGAFESRWWIVEQGNNQCRVDVTIRYAVRFGILGKILHGVVMKRKLKQGGQQAVDALKKHVETGELVRPVVARLVTSIN